MSEEKYLKLDNNIRCLNEMKIFPERYMGKYVTFEAKFNFLSRLSDDNLECLRTNGGNPIPFKINLDKCIEICVDGDDRLSPWLVYDLSQGEWIFDLKKDDPLIVKGYTSYCYWGNDDKIYKQPMWIVQELKRKGKLSGGSKYQTKVPDHKHKTSTSKYRKQLKQVLSVDQLAEVDEMVDSAKTTYQVIDECLKYGLSLDETWFLLETHRSLSFNPSIANLRKLFFQLRKDQDMLNDAIEFIEENFDFISESIHRGIEGFMKDDNVIYEFSKLLREHDDSLEKLKMHIESFQ